MAINVNPINTDALARLAGNTVPDYHLPDHAITGGDFFTNLTAQNNKDRELNTSQQNADTDKAKIPIEQQKADADTANAATNQFQAQTSRISANTMETYRAAQAHKDEIANKIAMDDDQANKRTAALSSALVASNQVANDPSIAPADKITKQATIQKTTLDTAYAHGLINKDEYTQGLSMSPDQFQSFAKTDFTNHVLANQLKGQKNAGDPTINPLNATNPVGAVGTTGKPTAAQTNANQSAILQTAVDTATTPEAKAVAVKAQQSFNAAANIHTNMDMVNRQTTASTLKEAAKDAANASNDQVNNTVLQNLLGDPNFVAGLNANNQTTFNRGLAAAAQAVGIAYDPHTAANEMMNDVSKRAQIDFYKMVGGRGNELQWKAAGEAVAHPTNTMAGLKGLASITDFNNAAKIKKNEFLQQFADANNASMVGAENAWENYLGSLGSPVDPKTRQFIAGQKLRASDPTEFATNPIYKKANVVKSTVPAGQGGFSPDPIVQPGASSSSKVLTYNRQTGKLE